MERTDWLDEGLNPAAARFLMLTAITHHRFSSPIWGEHEVRKLHAELAELGWLGARAVASHRSPIRMAAGQRGTNDHSSELRTVLLRDLARPPCSSAWVAGRRS